MQSGLTLRSNITQALQVINVNKNNIIQEQDVLRWGYANWGVEKVTSEYKPQEIK
jgi:predicted GNAT family N-acyltransferase